MRQRARVLEVKGKTATVSVSRASMCEGCVKSGGCGGHCDLTGLVAMDRSMKAEAQNPIGAKPGELVEVETDSRRVIGYAALVFLLPVIVCGLCYMAGSRLFGGEKAGVIAAAVGFVLTFALIALIDRTLRRRTPDIRIVERVGTPDEKADE